MEKKGSRKPILWPSCSPDTSRYKEFDELNPEIPVYTGGTIPRRIRNRQDNPNTKTKSQSQEN